VYVGPDADADHAYWIAQRTFDEPPKFDEWKVFLGFPSPARAELAFRLHAPAAIMGPTYQVPIGAMHALAGRDPRKGDGAGEELLGALRKAERDEVDEFSEGGRYGAPFPPPDVVNDQPPARPAAASVAAALERMRVRLGAMRMGLASPDNGAGLPAPPTQIAATTYKAGEGGGGEAAAEGVDEGAKEVAERVGELGEGHGGHKPGGHGKGKPGAAARARSTVSTGTRSTRSRRRSRRAEAVDRLATITGALRPRAMG
jgi:hypothetical protein